MQLVGETREIISTDTGKDFLSNVLQYIHYLANVSERPREPYGKT